MAQDPIYGFYEMQIWLIIRRPNQRQDRNGDRTRTKSKTHDKQKHKRKHVLDPWPECIIMSAVFRLRNQTLNSDVIKAHRAQRALEIRREKKCIYNSERQSEHPDCMLLSSRMNSEIQFLWIFPAGYGSRHTGRRTCWEWDGPLLPSILWVLFSLCEMCLNMYSERKRRNVIDGEREKDRKCKGQGRKGVHQGHRSVFLLTHTHTTDRWLTLYSENYEVMPRYLFIYELKHVTTWSLGH